MGQTASKRALCQLNRKPFTAVPGRENPSGFLKIQKYYTWFVNSLSLEYPAAGSILEMNACPLGVTMEAGV